MDKKTSSISGRFNKAANTSKDNGGEKSNHSPRTPKPQATLDMKGPIGNAVRAKHFNKPNNGLTGFSGKRRFGHDTLNSGHNKSPSNTSGLKDTFNPNAKGNNGQDHSR